MDVTIRPSTRPTQARSLVVTTYSSLLRAEVLPVYFVYPTGVVRWKHSSPGAARSDTSMRRDDHAHPEVPKWLYFSSLVFPTPFPHG